MMYDDLLLFLHLLQQVYKEVNILIIKFFYICVYIFIYNFFFFILLIMKL